VTGMSLSFSPARVSRVVVRGFGADLLGEQVVEPGDARPPQLLVAREQRAGASDHRRVRPDETLPPLGPFDDEARGFEHGDVLLHRRERHVVLARERGDRKLVLDRAPQDVPPRRGREGLEDAVDLFIAQLITYNHLVVGYERMPHPSTPFLDTALADRRPSEGSGRKGSAPRPGIRPEPVRRECSRPRGVELLELL